MGDILHDHRLAGSRLGHDQAALTLAERRDQLDDPAGLVLALVVLDLEAKSFLGVERRQIVEIDPVADAVGIVEIDLVDLKERKIAFAVLGCANLALHRVTGAKAEAPHLARADVDIVRSRQVVRLG